MGTLEKYFWTPKSDIMIVCEEGIQLRSLLGLD
jgi:hypothetical protein